jgi:hypothetical protein
VPLKTVKTAMHAAVVEMQDAQTLRIEWAAEDLRLRTLALRFYELALKDNSHQAATIFLKASERRATLAGSNVPQSYTVHATHQVSIDQKQSSTQEIAATLDIFLGVTDRERDLRSREALSNEEARELIGIEDQREEQRQAE